MRFAGDAAPLRGRFVRVNHVEMQMKNLMIAAGAAAVFAAFSLPALADDATGTIASIDAVAGLVTLDDGKIYKIPTTVALASFMTGQKVKITFDGQPQGIHFTKEDPEPATAIALDSGAGAPLAPGAGGNAGPATNPGAPRD
jgi:hypothetical protein